MKFILRLILILSAFQLLSAVKEENLPQKYRDWLKLVSYIILPQEKEVFLKLDNDRDRDLFIEIFWKQRDPTPGTPQNEFMDEHISRFLYANEHFRRGTSREGWMTDMGRIYIILGPPNSIERFDMQAGIYPCQVWYYYGDTKKGLPVHFAVIFYQRGGVGEYKLYNPASDGPESLIIDTQGLDTTNYQAVYNKIKELAPTLANVSFTLIPGQTPYYFQPSQTAPMLLAKISELPKKNVSPSYATNFLNYKGIVTTEYATNYIECNYSVSIFRDPVIDSNFVHFSISPKSISVDYFEPKEQFYLNYQLTVNLKKDEKIIFQYTKDYPLYFPPNEIGKIKSGGISIQDSFPVIEGDYTLTVLIQNSVAKEFSYFEKILNIPEKSGSPFISDFILSYDLKDENDISHLSYKIGEKRFFIDPKNTFSYDDRLSVFANISYVSREVWERGEIELKIESQERKEFVKTFLILLKEFPYSQHLGIFKTINPKELTPDYYQISIYLKEKERIIDSKRMDFTITNPPFSHPNVFSKRLPPSNNFFLFYMLANQAEQTKKNEKAEFYYKRALELKPDFSEGVLGYANFLLKLKRYDVALSIVEGIKDDAQRKFDYFLLKGQALMGLEKFSEAVDNFLEGNKIYNSDIRLLNSLGYSYHKLGKEEEALKALKASLSLNPNQKEVENLIKRIELKKK